MTLLICLPAAAAAKAATVCVLPNPYSLWSVPAPTSFLYWVPPQSCTLPEDSIDCGQVQSAEFWCLGTWKNICAACSTCGANLHNTCISHKHFDQSAGYTSNTSTSAPIHPHLPSNPNVCYFQLKLLRWLELSCKMLAGISRQVSWYFSVFSYIVCAATKLFPYPLHI